MVPARIARSRTRRPPPGRPSARSASLSNIAGELRAQVQGFVRSFGMLAAGQTPCGTPLGLSHAHALMFLLEGSRGATAALQLDLGRALGIDKSNVARLCRRMEEAGHLVQEPHADDGRARCLRLTPRGTQIAQEVERASQARFSRLAALMSADGCASVVASLRVLNDAVATLASPPREKEPGR